MKTFVGKLLCSKPAEFYVRGINKLPNNWSVVIQNDGEYWLKIIHWSNSLE